MGFNAEFKSMNAKEGREKRKRNETPRHQDTKGRGERRKTREDKRRRQRLLPCY
jgi:hypothetical protein